MAALLLGALMLAAAATPAPVLGRAAAPGRALLRARGNVAGLGGAILATAALIYLAS